MEKMKGYIAELESKLADQSINRVDKALDALIDLKDNPKPISLQRERIDSIKSNVMLQNMPEKILSKIAYKKPEGKKGIILGISDKIMLGHMKMAKKLHKGYIKHYSNYFLGLKAAQFEIKPRVISKITANKGNILRHLKEVYKNED